MAPATSTPAATAADTEGCASVTVGNIQASRLSNLSSLVRPVQQLDAISVSGLSQTATSSIGLATVTQTAASWDWQQELEGLSNVFSLNRADEANAARRSAEDIQRCLLRQLEETERRMLRAREEESAAFMRFLSGMHAATEARFERQAGQLAELQTQLGDEFADGLDRARGEAEAAEAARRSDLDALQHRFESLGAELTELTASTSSAVETAVASASASARQCVMDAKEALHAELVEAVDALTADVRAGADARSSLAARLDGLEKRADEAAQDVKALQPAVEALQPVVDACSQSLTQVRSEIAENMQVRSEMAEDMEAQRQARQREVQRLDIQSSTTARLQGELSEFSRSHATQELAMSDRCMQLSAEIQSISVAAEAASLRFAESAERASAIHLASAETFAEAHAGARVSLFNEEAAADLHRVEIQFGEQLEEQSECVEQLEQRLRDSEQVLAVSQKEQSQCVEQLEQRLRDSEEVLVVTHKELRCEADGAKAQLEQRLGRTCEELQASCDSMASELEGMKGQGLMHEWDVPRATITEARSRLDSESFFLGDLGPLTLRLHPSGPAGEQCILELHLTGSSPAPMYMDLAVGDLSRRVLQKTNGRQSVTWTAEALGDLLCVKPEECNADSTVRCRVELPMLQAVAAQRLQTLQQQISCMEQQKIGSHARGTSPWESSRSLETPRSPANAAASKLVTAPKTARSSSSGLLSPLATAAAAAAVAAAGAGRQPKQLPIAKNDEGPEGPEGLELCQQQQQQQPKDSPMPPTGVLAMCNAWEQQQMPHQEPKASGAGKPVSAASAAAAVTSSAPTNWRSQLGKALTPGGTGDVPARGPLANINPWCRPSSSKTAASAPSMLAPAKDLFDVTNPFDDGFKARVSSPATDAGE